MPRFLIDTNVMLAASACVELSALAEHAMPTELPLRETVYRWLVEFDEGDARMVLDDDGLIRGEYENNMHYNRATYEQEYGMRVLQNKIDRYQADHVPLDAHTSSSGEMEYLSDELCGIVTDRADRKWVAAAHAAEVLFGEVPPIVYGAESDWYEIEHALRPHRISFVRLLPDDWYEQRRQA
jgi:hypothetical protein